MADLSRQDPAVADSGRHCGSASASLPGTTAHQRGTDNLGNVKQVTSPQTCPAGSCRSPHLRRGQWTRLIRAPASTWHCLVCDCDSQAVIVLWLLRNHHFVRNLRSEEDSRTALRGADSGASARAGSSLSFHPEGPGERVFTSSWFKQTGKDVETVEPSLGELQGPDLGEICLETTREAREGPSSPRLQSPQQ